MLFLSILNPFILNNLYENMKAKIENQEREITSLRETIVSLRDEIQAQRELTREVANAGQKSVTQNFGK